MIKEIAFTAYPVTDMARARAFYEGVLGLTVETNHDDKWVEYDVGGGTFVIQTYSAETPSGNRGRIAFEVDDLDATVAHLKAAGTPFTMEVSRVARLPFRHGHRSGRQRRLGPPTQNPGGLMPVSMAPRFSALCLAALAACGLLTACPGKPEFHVILFNNTNDQVIFWRRAADPHPEVILACTGGNVTDLSTDGVMIQRNGTIYHYRYPAAYTYPSAAVPPGTNARCGGWARRFASSSRRTTASICWNDGRPTRISRTLAQPAGFPLEPTQTDAVPAPRKKEKGGLPL